MADTSTGVTRRTVAKGAAWTVPAMVTIGALAPDAAASVVCVNGTCFLGTACKMQGSTCNSYNLPGTGTQFVQAYAYYMRTTIPSNHGSCVTIKLDSMTVNGTTYNAPHAQLALNQTGTCSSGCTGASACGAPAGSYIQVAAGCSVDWIVYVNNQGNSANGVATIAWSAYDSSTSACTLVPSLSGSLTTGSNNLPVCSQGVSACPGFN